MSVDSAEHVVTITAAVIVARCTILGIGVFPTWIVHKIALADVDASGVERVIVFVAVFVVGVVGVAGSAAAAAGVGGVAGTAEVAEGRHHWCRRVLACLGCRCRSCCGYGWLVLASSRSSSHRHFWCLEC